MQKYFFLLFVCSFLLAGCFKDKTRPGQTTDTTTRPVKTVVVLKEPICILSGSVSISEITPLSFNTAGKIKKVYVQKNEIVLKDQKLLSLKNKPIKKHLAVLANQYSKLLLATLKDKSHIKNSEGQLSALEKELAESRKQLGDTRLKAPSSGVITAIFEDKGAIVKAGQKILELQESHNMYFLADIPKHTNDVLTEDKVTYYANSPKLPERYFRVYKTKTQENFEQVELEFKAVDSEEIKGLQKGMPLNIYALSSKPIQKKCSLKIPFQSVIADAAGRPQVWLVNLKENTVSPRLVTTGRIKDGHITILNGLTEGDQIVINGIDEMHEGKRIKIFISEPVFLKELD